jgi:hypothetical protein
MQRILTFITRLTRFCLQSFHHRFVAWTKPDTTSLLLGMVTDLSRSKSELVAENALLRQQLIILRRQVKRPACTRTDRILLVLLARLVRTWQQALVIVQPDTRLAVASGALPFVLETQIKGLFPPAQDRRGNDRASSGRWPRTIGFGVLKGFGENC